MSLVKTTELGVNNYELEVNVDAETFEKGLQAAYRQEVKKIVLPGFRKGKAPRKFIENAYGEGFFYDAAINNTYREAMSDAIKDSELKVIPNSAKVDVKDAGKDGYTFTVNLYTYPVVKIENYKGIEVEKPSEEVTEEDINSAIDAEREKLARFTTVEDQSAKTGDTVVIDFKGFIDDKAFEGGESQDYNLSLGSHQFIDGFEDQIVGHKAGEEFDINVKFPADYHAEEFRDKDAKFEIKLKEVKAKELPDVDDEFVKDISEFDTLDEFKEDLKKKISEKKKKDSEATVNENLSNKIVELLQADIPEIMYENKIDSFVNEFDMKLRSQGLDRDMYMRYTGMDEQAMREGCRPNAVAQVKLRLALEEIAKLENIEVSDETIEEEYKKLAESYKVDVENVKVFISEEMLKDDIAVGEAMDLVKKAAVLKTAE